MKVFKLGEERKKNKSFKKKADQDISDIINLIEKKIPKKSTKPLIKSATEPIPVEETSEISELVQIKRAYDYVGGDIHFKVAVQNISNAVLTDLNITLIPAEQYEISDRVKVVGSLKPNESRGLDFNLVPLTCGRSKIFGSCSFMDAFGNPHSITIPSKEIWIKCPLVEPKSKSMSEIESIKKELQKGTAKIPLLISEDSAFNLIIDQISALDLSEVTIGDFKGVYSGEAKITSDLMIIEAKVEDENALLTVWTKDLKQVTGFLAYLKNSIKLALDTALRIEETTETICQKILRSNEIIQRFISLFTYCEEQWTMGECLILIKEIRAKLKKRFPESPIISRLKDWIDDIEKAFRDEEAISEQKSIEFEFNVINWLKDLNRIANDNLETYEQAFPEQAIQIQQLNKLLKDNDPLITNLEMNYIKRVLHYLMVIEKGSGLSLFEYNFAKSTLNPNLISGFLTAIQSFGQEISNEETAITKLAYKNFEIGLEEREKIIGALILNGSPTEGAIKKLKSFIEDFELKFKNVLESSKKDVSVFKDAENLIKRIF